MNKKSAKFTSFILASVVAFGMPSIVNASGKAPENVKNKITETDIENTNAKTKEDLNNVEWCKNLFSICEKLLRDLQSLEEMCDNVKNVHDYYISMTNHLRSCGRTIARCYVASGEEIRTVKLIYPWQIEETMGDSLLKFLICVGNKQYNEAEAYLVSVLDDCLNLLQYLKLVAFYTNSYFDIFKFVNNLSPGLDFVDLGLLKKSDMEKLRNLILIRRGCHNVKSHDIVGNCQMIYDIFKVASEAIQGCVSSIIISNI